MQGNMQKWRIRPWEHWRQFDISKPAARDHATVFYKTIVHGASEVKMKTKSVPLILAAKPRSNGGPPGRTVSSLIIFIYSEILPGQVC